ncbi:MAG: LexA family transcriptional regulator [Eubacteriales bacterium]|nr:LexA family transcriptional regulator [Eubacteriales bacterium]
MKKKPRFSMKKFSTRLYALRKESGYTQEELCERLFTKYEYKTNKGVISKYENGKHEPNLYFVDIVSDLFGVSIDYLSGKSDEKYALEGIDNCRPIPILGTIAAGFPIFAQENVEGCEYVPKHFNADFCLKVKGDSMIGARILDGNLVFVRKQCDVEHGEIAAVLIDKEEATLKRVFKVNGSIILHSENPNYPDKVFSKKDMREITIIGKALMFKSEVR